MFGIDSFVSGLSNYAGAINLVSTAFSAFGAIKRGREEGAYLDYEASKADEAARIERGVAAVRAKRTRRAGESTISAASAGYAGAGVDVSSGSAAFVQGDIARRIELDALSEILSGDRRAEALETSASEKRMAGDKARSGSWWGAGTSLLGGLARQSEISKWKRRGDGLDANGYNALGTRGPIGGTAADPWYG